MLIRLITARSEQPRHRRRELVAGQVQLDQLGRQGPDLVVAVVCAATEVRRKRAVLQPKERIVERGRLVLEDVQHRVGDRPGTERVGEGGGIDHSTARDVDKQRRWFHRRKLLRPEEVVRGLIEDDVNGNHVGVLEQPLERYEFGAKVSGGGRIDEWVRRKD